MKHTSATPLFKAQVSRSLHGFKPYVPGRSTESLMSEFGFSASDICKLASNENPMPTTQVVQEALKSQVAKVGRYPDPDGEPLRGTICETFGVNPAQITLGNGSNEILEDLAAIFCQPGDTALYSEHGFAIYPLAIKMAGAEAVEVPAKDYGHDIVGFINIWQRLHSEGRTPKLIYLANPNNPTGTWFDRQALDKLLDAVDNTLTIVVLDEAYSELVLDLPEYPLGFNYLSQHPNLVVTRTFSKAYGLAGLRVGYAVSHEDIALWLNAKRAPFNVNCMALAAANAALTDSASVQAYAYYNRDALNDLQEWCRQKGLDYIPSIANFLTIAVQQPSDSVFQHLQAKGVIARSVSVYGLPEHLRVSVGSEAENSQFKKMLLDIL